jgi:bifunctional UDP-N-acetylglucosamine pyrophosphorylase / glucosamine-1-phosphate N-acetyltransferase
MENLHGKKYFFLKKYILIKYILMDLSVIILCAGKGTRMKDSKIPKVCKKVGDLPMISHIFNTVKLLNPEQIIIVVSNENKDIISKTINSDRVEYVIQKELPGTAGAVLAAKSLYKNKNILVLLGDVPLIKINTLQNIVSSKANGLILGFLETEDNKFGRIILNGNKVEKIVEYSEASEEEKKISQVNSGILYLDNKYTKLLNNIENKNSKKEYYLTDIVGIIRKIGIEISYLEASKEECMGANTPSDLLKLENYLKI